MYTASGRVNRVMTLGESDVEANTQAGETALLLTGSYQSSNIYIVDGEAQPRTEMPDLNVSQDGDIVTVDDIPDDTIVRWPDGTMTRESGSFSFESNITGAHRFYIDAPQYLPKWVNIDVA